jgi:hypothetical protein
MMTLPDGLEEAVSAERATLHLMEPLEEFEIPVVACSVGGSRVHGPAQAVKQFQSTHIPELGRLIWIERILRIARNGGSPGDDGGFLLTDSHGDEMLVAMPSIVELLDLDEISIVNSLGELFVGHDCLVDG